MDRCMIWSIHETRWLTGGGLGWQDLKLFPYPPSDGASQKGRYRIPNQRIPFVLSGLNYFEIVRKRLEPHGFTRGDQSQFAVVEVTSNIWPSEIGVDRVGRFIGGEPSV